MRNFIKVFFEGFMERLLDWRRCVWCYDWFVYLFWFVLFNGKRGLLRWVLFFLVFGWWCFRGELCKEIDVWGFLFGILLFVFEICVFGDVFYVFLL